MTNTLKLKNIEIENFIREIQDGAIAELKKSKTLPTPAKSAIYRLAKKISEAPETKAYLEQKQQLGEDLQSGEKEQADADKEFQEILEQDSGLEITKPEISESDLLEVLSVDEMIQCDWLFDIKEG